jgi:hypothetical protein
MNYKVLNFNAVYSKGNIVFFEKKGKLYQSNDYGETVKYIASYPSNIFEKLTGLTSRIVRGGLHSLVLLPNGGICAIKRKAVLYKAKSSKKFEIVFEIPRGSRPLNICYNPITDKLYFGEYFSNTERKEVYVYSSSNGKDWIKEYCFPQGKIRHIHGIFFDAFRKGMWVLSGDTDEESHLWFTADDFKTLKSIVGGTQKARAVSIIPKQKNIIVPTDTPIEKNFIQLLDDKSQVLKTVSNLPGSAFYAESIGRVNIVSTVVEKSEINKVDFASVYISTNGEEWTNIFNLKQDIYSKISLKFFSYPEIKPCKGDESSKYIFLNCKGVKKYHGKCLRFSIEEILKLS